MNIEPLCIYNKAILYNISYNCLVKKVQYYKEPPLDNSTIILCFTNMIILVSFNSAECLLVY